MSKSYHQKRGYYGSVDEKTGEGPIDWVSEDYLIEPQYVVCGVCWKTTEHFQEDKKADTGWRCSRPTDCDPQ